MAVLNNLAIDFPRINWVLHEPINDLLYRDMD